MRNEMKKAQGTVKGFASNVGAMLKKLAVVFAGVFAIKKIIEFGKASKAAADEMAVNEAKLAVIMRKRMQATDETIQSVKDLIAAQESIGVVDVVAQTSAAQELATYLSNASSLKTILPTLNDLVAQQYGMSASAEQATGMATMLGKVLDGQTGALKRYGFSFDAAQEKILKYGSEASRVALVADIVRDSIGNMNAELGKTPQGQWKQIQYTFDAIKITVGQGLTPVLQQLLPYIKAVANALLRAAQYASAFMQSLFGSSKQVAIAGAQADAVDDVAGSYDDAGKAAKKAASSVAGFDEVNTLASQSKDDNSVGSYTSNAGMMDGVFDGLDLSMSDMAEKAKAAADKVRLAIKSLITDEDKNKILKSVDEVKKSFKNLGDSFDGFTKNDSVKKVGGFLANVFKDTGIGVFTGHTTFLKGQMDLLGGSLKAVDGVLSGDFDKSFKGAETVASGFYDTINGLAYTILPQLGDSMKKNKEKFSEYWRLLRDDIKKYGDPAKLEISDFIDFTKAKFSNGFHDMGKNTSSGMENIRYILFDKWTNMVKEIDWGAISSTVSAVWQTIKSNTSLAWQNIKQSVSDIWSTFITAISWDSIKTVVSNVWTDMKRVASEEWNSMRTTISGIWDSFLTAIKWDAIKNVVANTWNDLKTVTSNTWGDLKQLIHDKWDAITKIDFSGVKNGLLNVWDDLSKRTATVWDGIGKTIKDSINSVIDIVNGFITQVNSIKIDIPKVEVGNFKVGGGSIGMPAIPKIPKLAKGGITNGEMLATIGDNPGGEEVVSPLSDLLGMINSSVAAAMSANQQMGGNSQSQPVINLQIDGVTFARINNAYSAKENTRIGGSMITVT